MTIHRVSASLVGAACLLVAARSDAAEPEPVRFEVGGDCIREAALRQDIRELGGSFRDANLDDRARVLRVEASRGAIEASGRLIVRDLVFRESVRTTRGPDCATVEKALALFVATALDEHPEEVQSDRRLSLLHPRHGRSRSRITTTSELLERGSVRAASRRLSSGRSVEWSRKEFTPWGWRG